MEKKLKENDFIAFRNTVVTTMTMDCHAHWKRPKIITNSTNLTNSFIISRFLNLWCLEFRKKTNICINAKTCTKFTYRVILIMTSTKKLLLKSPSKLPAVHN